MTLTQPAFAVVAPGRSPAAPEHAPALWLAVTERAAAPAPLASDHSGRAWQHQDLPPPTNLLLTLQRFLI
jgi:hypothetical protein